MHISTGSWTEFIFFVIFININCSIFRDQIASPTSGGAKDMICYALEEHWAFSGSDFRQDNFLFYKLKLQAYSPSANRDLKRSNPVNRIRIVLLFSFWTNIWKHYSEVLSYTFINTPAF